MEKADALKFFTVPTYYEDGDDKIVYAEKDFIQWRKDNGVEEYDENGILKSNYGMIWIDVEENPSSGCSWASYSAASNCDYVG